MDSIKINSNEINNKSLFTNSYKKVLSSKKINDYLNKKKYLKLYEYVTTNIDNYNNNHKKTSYHKKIPIKNFDIIIKNIEIRKEFLLYECKRHNNYTEHTKMHHQLHMIYCFLIQNCCDVNDTSKKRLFIHNYMLCNT